MKAIFLPLALAALAVDARASHRDGFFMSFGKFGFGFSAPVHYAPVAPVYFAPVGHYEYRERQVYVPGCFETVWIDPVFENRRYHYRTIRLCVRAGYYRTEKYRVWVPGPVVCR